MQTADVWPDLPEIEHLDGIPYFKVSPKRTHAYVQARLLRVLEDCAGAAGEALPEWRFNLGAVDRTRTDLVPDIAYVSNDRLARYTDAEIEEPPFAPDIVIEIRSPESNRKLIEEKIARYLKCGSTLVLDVDPQTRTIAAHHRTCSQTYGPTETFKHAAAPWLVFELAQIFPKPRSKP